MNKNTLDRIHIFSLRMPSLLEKVVAAILLVGVACRKYLFYERDFEEEI